MRNDGASSLLNITSLTVPTGFSIVSPSVPFAVAAGSSQEVLLEFDSATIAPATAVAGDIVINSDDPNNPTETFAISGGVATFSKLIANWDFEAPGSDAAGDTDTFAIWNEAAGATSILDVPGIVDGTTTTSAYIGNNNGLAGMDGELATAANNFTVELKFAIQSGGSTTRLFNTFFIQEGGGVQINLRYEDGAFDAFDSGWQEVLDLSATPLLASTDANDNGDLTDPGDVVNVYTLRLTGTDWGSGAPTYQLEILDAAGTSTIGTSPAGLSFFQNGVPTAAGLGELRFTTEFGGNPGFWVDNVCVSGTVYTPVEAYAASFGLSGGDIDSTADPEPDLLNNLLEFAFGLIPNVSDNAPLGVVDGDTFTPGTPTTSLDFSSGLEFNARWVRRKDAAEVGLTYTPQFSATMAPGSWVSSSAIPVVVSDDGGDYEVVEIPYLLFITSGPDSGMKARFFRMLINSTGTAPLNP